MKCLRLSCLMFSLLLVPAFTLRADPSITCNTSPIVLGQGAQFELDGDYMGWSLSSRMWEYQWVVGACTTPWSQFGNGDWLVQMNLQYPGTLKLRSTVVYNDGSGGHRATLQPTSSITVPKPDGVLRLNVLFASETFGKNNPSIFQITCNGQDRIYMNGQVVQERISNLRNAVTNKLVKSMGQWVPVTVNDPAANNFYYQGSGIFVDLRFYPLTAWIASLPADTPFLTAHQEFRVILRDLCGNAMAPISLGSKEVTFTKDTQNQRGGTYTVTEQ